MFLADEAQSTVTGRYKCCYENLSQHTNMGLSCHKMQNITTSLPLVPCTVLWAGILDAAVCFVRWAVISSTDGFVAFHLAWDLDSVRASS